MGPPELIFAVSAESRRKRDGSGRFGRLFIPHFPGPERELMPFAAAVAAGGPCIGARRQSPFHD